MKKSTVLAGASLLMLAATTAMAALPDPVQVDGIFYQVTGENTCRVMPDVTGGPNTNSYKGFYNVPASVVIDGKTYTVSEIGKEAFARCWNITGVTLPPTIERIDSQAFASSKGIKTLTLPASLRVIESDAFSFSGLTELKIEEGLDSVGYGGLGYINEFTDTLRLPASLRAMSPAALAFSHKLQAISVHPDNKWWKSEDGVVFSKDGSTLFAFPCYKYSEEYTIPSSVKYIETHSCSNLDRMTAFKFPYSQIRIGKEAFTASNKLLTIKNASNVVQIDSAAFAGCTRLELFQAGYGLKRIGDNAFSSAARYNDNGVFYIDLSYASNLTYIGSYAFGGAKMPLIRIPQKVDTICYDAFQSSTLEKFDVNPSNAYFTSINGVLYDKTLTKLLCVPPYYADEIFDIPEGIVELGDGAFYGAGVKLVNFPGSIRKFGREAFSHCSLAKINIPETIGELPYECFANSSLPSVTVPPTVKGMDGGVFAYCSSLVEANLPDELDSLPPGTFFNCEKLAKVNIPANAKSVGYNSFAQCFALDSINFPDACIEIGHNAFRTANNPMRQGKIRVLIFGKNLKTIGDQAFTGQNEITDITSYNLAAPGLEAGGEGAFMANVYDKATVTIYDEAETAYKTNALWSPFQNWKFMKYTGIRDIEYDADNAIVATDGAIEARGEGLMQVFTLDGRTIYSGPATRVTVPSAGMYIVRLGSLTKKVIL